MNKNILPIALPVAALLILVAVLVLRGRESADVVVEADTGEVVENVEAVERPRDSGDSAVAQVAEAPRESVPTPPSQSETVSTEASAVEAPPVEATPEAAPSPPVLVVRVLEEETEEPLTGALVRLESTRGQRVRPRMTGEDGATTFEGLDSGFYLVNIQWGQGPPKMAGRVVVPETGPEEATVYYLRRESFLMQLADETGRPVPNMSFEASAGGGWRGGWMDVVTDGEGFFELKGYTDTNRWQFRSEDSVMFSAGDDRRWGNPYEWNRQFSEEADGDVLFMQRDLVEATAVLINPPPLETDQGRLYAAVLGSELEQDNIRIEGDQFSFQVPPGIEVQVRVGRSERGWRGRSRGGEVEKETRVQMPDKAGPFRFEIEFEDRIEVPGIVVASDTGGIEGVEVQARSQPANLRISAGDTDSEGEFTISVPPDTEWTFEPDLRSLPDEYKGFTPVTKTWKQLEAGERVVLRLEPSSIVWGEVVMPGGQPVEGAVVSMQGSGVTWNSWTVNTRSDGEGVFRLNIPPMAREEAAQDESTDWVLAWSRERGVGFAPAQVDDPSSPVKVELIPYVKLNITVSANGAPFESARITPMYNVPWRDSPLTFGSGGVRPVGVGVYEADWALPGIGMIQVTGRVDGQERREAQPIPAGIPSPYAMKFNL